MSKVNKNATEHEFVTPDEEPAAKNNETKAEKFIRLGEYRMNKAIDAIGRLEHLANKSAYEYTAEQVKAQIQDFLPEKFADAEVAVHQVVKNNDCVLDGLTIQGAQQVNDVAAGEPFDESLDSRAGNKPLQGVSKPPAKPVVMISQLINQGIISVKAHSKEVEILNKK